MEKIQTDIQVQRLSVLRAAYENELYAMRLESAGAPRASEAMKANLESTEADLERRDAAPDKLWRIGGETFEGEEASARAGAKLHQSSEEDGTKMNAAHQAVKAEYQPQWEDLQTRLEAAKAAAAVEGKDYVKGSKARLKELEDLAKETERGVLRRQ